MMDYKATSITGDQWQRCSAIHIANHYGQTPVITLSEEVITEFNGEQITRGAGGMAAAFDPSEVIPLLDPSTGAPLGSTITQAEIHIALWSFYMKKAAERDANN